MAVLSASAVVSTAPASFQNELSSPGAGCSEGLSWRASLRRNTNDKLKKSSVHATYQRINRLSRLGSFIWSQWNVLFVFLQPVLLSCAFRGIFIERFHGDLLEQSFVATNRAQAITACILHTEDTDSSVWSIAQDGSLYVFLEPL